MTTIMEAKVVWCTKVSLLLISFIYSEKLNECTAILLFVFNRIKQCHKILSSKQVNNEDLDNQLGSQILTALLTLLETIDHDFHAGLA